MTRHSSVSDKRNSSGQPAHACLKDEMFHGCNFLNSRVSLFFGIQIMQRGIFHLFNLPKNAIEMGTVVCYDVIIKHDNF